MESTIQKRMNNLLVRIGDEGVDFYYKNLEQLINLTPKFMQQEDSKNYFLNKLRLCVQKIPYKSFVYAIFYAVEINNYPEFENLMDLIFEDLQKNLNELNLLEADNVLLFLGELIKLNVLNSFTFISILMDLVSGCENFQDHFDFFFYLTLNSIAHVQKILQEKFEMEFKNLIDDLERIVQKQIDKNPNIKNRWLYQYFEALKDNINLKEASFELKNTQCLNLLKNQKTLRKTFKLNLQIAPNTNQQCQQFLKRDENQLFNNSISNILQKQNSLNKHLLDIYIQKNFLSYNKNINLLLDKYFFKNFGKFKSAKDFILIKQLLLNLQNCQELKNQLLSSILLSKLVNCFDFFLFLKDCWKQYQNYFVKNLEKFTLKELDNIVKNVTNFNYLTHKNFELIGEDYVINKENKIFQFVNDLLFLQQINYNLNREDAYKNHNKDPKKYQQDENNNAFSYVNQYLLSNSNDDNFFNFAEEILGFRKDDSELRKLFFQIFVLNSSQSFVHFKSYFDHYKGTLSYYLRKNEFEFYQTFISFNVENYFVLQKCLVYLYNLEEINKQELLKSIFQFLNENDYKLDICLLKTLKEIQNIQLIYGKDITKQIQDMLNEKLKLNSEKNQYLIMNRYSELLK